MTWRNTEFSFLDESIAHEAKQMQFEEIFIWEKNEKKPDEFRYSMTIANNLLVG